MDTMTEPTSATVVALLRALAAGDMEAAGALTAGIDASALLGAALGWFQALGVTEFGSIEAWDAKLAEWQRAQLDR